MKNLLAGLWLMLLLLSTGNLAAQEYFTSDKKALKAYENARLSFDQRRYQLALEFLQEAIERDANFLEAYLMQFEVFTEMGNKPEAETALEKSLALNPDFFPNAWFFLGELEFQQGKYKEAQPHLEQFLTYPNLSNDLAMVARRDIANCKFALEAVKNPVDFSPENLGTAINTPSPEYYPTLTADGQTLIFTRLVQDPESFQGKNEDFYISRQKDGNWMEAVPLQMINSKFNEGAPTISADGRFLVFTACELHGDYGPGRKGFGSCDLFYSKKVGDRWTMPVNMGQPVNSGSWETQPSLSADGNTLYFVKGKPTRQGVQMQDIYYTKRRDDGSWTVPQPVGNRVNTGFKEESVFIHPDGQTLYFSSNGHIGMGGLDLYYSRRQPDGEWGEAVNLGYPINSHEDENSLLVSADGKLAFFASKRADGFGDLDLYHFDLHPEARPVAVTYAEGIVFNAKSKEPLEATFELFDVERDSLVIRSQSDAVTGDFLVALPSGKMYALNVYKPGYLFYSDNFELKDTTSLKPFELKIPLKPIEAGQSVVLRNIFFDTDQAVLKFESQAELTRLAAFLQENPQVRIEISGHTDNQGTEARNVELSKNRALAVKNFLTDMLGIDGSRLTAKGYAATQPVADNETEEGRAKNRRTEVKIIE